MSAVPNLPASIVKLDLHDDKSIKDNAPETITTNGAINGTSRVFELPDLPADHARPLKIIVIGAGFSGIYLGIRISERLRDVDLIIYDKNEDVGGTWFENKYPGCACDIPCTWTLSSSRTQRNITLNYTSSSLVSIFFQPQPQLVCLVRPCTRNTSLSSQYSQEVLRRPVHEAFTQG